MRAVFAVAIVTAAVAPARADHARTPVDLTLFQPYSLTGSDDIVTGLDLGLFQSSSYETYGLDISFGLNVVTHQQAGLQITGFGGYVERAMGTLQIAGLANGAGSADAAIQIAGLGNFLGEGFAIQLALFGNFRRGPSSGLQVGALNMGFKRYSGVQIGGFNVADEVHGLQIGIVNLADRLVGVQIGLVNVNVDSSLPFTVLVNIGW